MKKCLAVCIGLLMIVCLLAGCKTKTSSESTGEQESQPVVIPPDNESDTTSKTNWPPKRPQNRKKVDSIPVIAYHHVVPDADKQTERLKDNMYTISDKEFDEQLQIFKDTGFYTITLQELYLWKKGEIEEYGKPLVITFDDGYKSAREIAGPILKKHGFCAGIFVIGHNVKDEEQEWNVEVLQSLSKNEIQNDETLRFYSHTYDMHKRRDDKAFVVTATDEELIEDFNAQEKVTGNQFLAYPFGASSESVVRIAKTKGTLLAFVTEIGSVTRADDDFLLPRYSLFPGSKIKDLKFM